MGNKKYRCRRCHKLFSFKDIKEHSKKCRNKRNRKELEEIEFEILPKVNNIKLRNEIVSLIERRQRNLTLK
jgi:hypothetical protein